MRCEEFEECLTDYLDGFLPAHLYHRWERHAALCDRCTELPGEVVRAIGACYTYISEEKPLPAGLNERILQATLGTVTPQEIKAPWTVARRVAVPLVAGSDHLAATRYRGHDVSGSDCSCLRILFQQMVRSVVFTTAGLQLAEQNRSTIEVNY